MSNERIAAITENIYTKFTARIAMISLPFVASGLVWLGSSWLEGKFENIAVPLGKVDLRVQVLETSDRVTELKNQSQDIYIQSNKESIAAIADQVKGVVTEMGKVNSSLQDLARSISDRERRLSVQP